MKPRSHTAFAPVCLKQTKQPNPVLFRPIRLQACESCSGIPECQNCKVPQVITWSITTTPHLQVRARRGIILVKKMRKTDSVSGRQGPCHSNTMHPLLTATKNQIHIIMWRKSGRSSGREKQYKSLYFGKFGQREKSTNYIIRASKKDPEKHGPISLLILEMKKWAKWGYFP